MGDLALKVRELHPVVVHDADRAHPRRCEIEHERAAEPSRTDHQDSRRLEPRLSDAAHLLEEDVPGVAADFVFGKIQFHEASI